MATIAPLPVPCKPSRAYYAILDEQHGTLAQLDGTMYFLADDTEALTAITPEHLPFVMTLGCVGLADTQGLLDRLHGGAARICTSRAN
jgi:hypothetical protein